MSDDSDKLRVKTKLKPHPTSLAFSQALQNHLELKQQKSNTTKDCGKKKKTTISNSIQRKALQLGWRNRHSQSTSYPITLQLVSKEETKRASTVTFSVNQILDTEITSSQDIDHDEQTRRNNTETEGEEVLGNTGAYIWPASVVLIKFLESNAKKIFHSSINNNDNNNTTVLDLGAGTGVTSFAAAILGASFVICTDGSKQIVDLAQHNLDHINLKFDSISSDTCDEECESPRKTNSDSPTMNPSTIQKQVYVCEFFWGNEEHKQDILQNFTEHRCSYPDIILVSDCLLPKLFSIEPLVGALVDCMGANTTAYLSYEYRFYEQFDPKERFVKLATQSGLFVEEISHDDYHPIYQASDIEIFKVTRK